jgi:VWFA-related protein
MWDAVWLTCEETLRQSPANAKRAIILMSDGWDTFSERKLTVAIARAIKAGVVIYAIGVGDDKNFDGTNKGDLRKLTERTGGRAFFPKKVGELQTAMGEITQELRNHYVVTYTPSEAKANDSFKRLNIILVNPEKKREGIKLAHQHGYYSNAQ